MSETYANRFRQSVIHPAISISMPFFFLLVLCMTVNQAAALPVFDTGFFVLLLALQCEEAIGSLLVKRERAAPLVRFRELIILLGLSYLLLGIPRGGPLGERFRPDLVYIVRLVSLAAGWILSFNIHARLHTFEAFSAVRGTRRGSALHRAVRDAAHIVGSAHAGLLAVRRFGNIFLVADGMVILVLWLAGSPPGVAELISYCLFCMCYVIVRSAVSIELDEIELAGDGLALSLKLVRNRVHFAAFFGGVALVIALLYAGNRSILPYGLLARFFSWLGSLFSQKTAPVLRIRQPATLAPPMPDLRGLFGNVAAVKPLPWLDTLWQVLRIVALAAAAAAVLVFIFGPLFSHDFRSFLRRINPITAIMNGLLRILRAGGRRLRAFVRAAKRLFGGLSAVEATDLGDLKKNPQRAVFRPTRRKRMEIDRVRREFLRVVMWGEDAGIHYTDCLTANEYAAKVASVRDGCGDELSRFADIFDEAIYSQRELGVLKLRLLHESVDSLVHSR